MNFASSFTDGSNSKKKLNVYCVYIPIAFSSIGWNWNFALKPCPGQSEFATKSINKSGPVDRTSNSVPSLQITLIAGSADDFPS